MILTLTGLYGAHLTWLYNLKNYLVYICMCTCLCVYDVCKYGQICATVQVWGSEELSGTCSHLPLRKGRVSLGSDTVL